MDVVFVELRQNDNGYAARACEQLERGNVLLVCDTSFLPSPSDAEFLRACRQSSSTTHKNIAYKPNRQVLTGVDAGTQEAQRLKEIMACYSEGALAFLAALLPGYSQQWRVDYASFRAVEEEGRDLPMRHRNDLLHLDAFPTRPTQGGRILRAFTNLNPVRPRVWETSRPFGEIAGRFARAAGLQDVVGMKARARRAAAHIANRIGLGMPARSAYDEFMLGFHHYLKANGEFQQNWRCKTIEFAPGATWISFTDGLAHAVLSGQYALEQTVIVPRAALVLPDLAPVAILERLVGQPLAAG